MADDVTHTPGPHNGSHGVYYYDEYYPYADGSFYDYYDDHLYMIFGFEMIIFGYIWPILVIFIFLCNVLVIFGFLRQRVRNPTNIILVAIAISDSLTGLVTLPATFHIYTNGNEFLTKDWCNFSMISRLYISRAFHTISVWQTVLLGLHRFMQTRYPLKAERMCTMKKTLVSVAILYLAAFILHMYHAFDVKADFGFCHWTLSHPCGWDCVYIWCTLLFSNLIPCFLLIGLAVFMIRAARDLNRRLEFTELTSRRQHEKNRNITIVVILIVVIFLIPELPYGIFFVIIAILRHGDQQLFPLETNRLIHCIYELLLLLTFHLNFWVYCILFRHFRQCLKACLRLVSCQKAPFNRFDSESSSSSRVGQEMVGITSETDAEAIVEEEYLS